MQYERKSEIESDTHELEQELYAQQPNRSKIMSIMGSLYNKINNIAPLIPIAIQLANLYDEKVIEIMKARNLLYQQK